MPCIIRAWAATRPEAEGDGMSMVHANRPPRVSWRAGIAATTAAALVLGLGTAPSPARAATAVVRVTPLGSHTGEFCAFDRALVFEDPDGTRILYDPGRTVRGPQDPRLGHIDAVLLSHVHADHLGDAVQPAQDAGSCAKPDTSVSAVPQSNTVDIAVGTHAKLVVGGEMAKFFALKLKEAGGQPQQVQLLRFGGSTHIGGVSVTSVQAAHSNGLDPVFLHKEQAQALESNGLTAYLGPPGGFVLQFSNGLVAYLSGDTGVMAEQELVVRREYHAKLVVLNIGGTFTTGPTEAAYVVNELVQPAWVIASHANEAATRGGQVQPGTRSEAFIKAAKMPVVLPLSGRTMSFDAGGACVGGC
jgi:L-ascorbate metabolism protein UlaG (beta-lactamase superfamily)